MKKKFCPMIKFKNQLSKLLFSFLLIFVGCVQSNVEDEDRIPMNVEYDYQYDIGWMDNCDVFPNGESRMDSSFSEAKTNVFILRDKVDLIPNTAETWDILCEWIRRHYIYNVDGNETLGPKEPMYLFGIMDQHPRDSSIIQQSPEYDSAFAITFPSGMGEGLGTPYGGVSVIFSCYTKIVAGDTWGWDEDTVRLAFAEIVIHEFGHQRADLPRYYPQDPWPHTPNSECVMVAGIRDENNKFLGWYYFCDYCKGQIKEHTWGKEKKEAQNVKK